MNSQQQQDSTASFLGRQKKESPFPEQQNSIKQDKELDRQEYIAECKRLLSGLRGNQSGPGKINV